MTHDFASRAASLQREVDTNLDAVYHLRAIEEDWARHLLGLSATGNLPSQVHTRIQRAFDQPAAIEAVRHLEAAEKWQRQIGSYATGSGEGLVSMGEVHALQMARAWLTAALFVQTRDVALLKQATALALAVEQAHNGMGRRYAGAIRRLRAFISA